MKRTVIAAVMVLICVCFVCAQENAPVLEKDTDIILAKKGEMHEECGEGEECGPGHRIAKALDLTDEQLEKLMKLNEDFEMKMAKLKIKMEKEKLELAELFLEEKVDKSAVYKKSEKISELHAEIQTATLDHFFNALEILDDEQKQKFSLFFMKKFMGRGKHGMPGGVKEKIKEKKKHK